MTCPKSRQSSAPSGPNPATSPGESDSPSHVLNGIVTLTIPATAGPPGAPAAPPGASRRAAAAALGPTGAPLALAGGSSEATGWPLSRATNTCARS